MLKNYKKNIDLLIEGFKELSTALETGCVHEVVGHMTKCVLLFHFNIELLENVIDEEIDESDDSLGIPPIISENIH